MLLSVFWLTTFGHLCDVTRTHFSTKAHWVTLYWRYEMHPFFWWHLHLSGGLESRQKSFVYSGVNPYPHPIYINNPLSFLRKVKHHYHLWSCLTCREHMHSSCLSQAQCPPHSPPSMTFHPAGLSRDPHGIGLKDSLPLLTTTDDMICSSVQVQPPENMYIPCEIKLKLYPFRKFVHVPSTYAHLLKICNMKFIPPKHTSPGN